MKAKENFNLAYVSTGNLAGKALISKPISTKAYNIEVLH